MHWNYRVVKDDRTDEPEFLVAEVFYDTEDDSEPMGWTESWTGGESEESLRMTLDSMLRAFDKPTIVHSETWPEHMEADEKSLTQLAQEMIKDPDKLKAATERLLGQLFPDKDNDKSQ